MSNASQFYGSKPFRGMTLKAWLKFPGAAGGITSSFNVTSCTRTGVGVYNIVFTSALAASLYMAPMSQIGVNHTSTYDGVECSISARTTTTCAITMKQVAGTATDFGDVYLEFWE